MGCWNKTCGLTNLPIFVGEPTVTFILVQTPPSEINVQGGTNTYWNYIPLPIYGTYNDYGWIDEAKYQGPTMEILEKLVGINCVRRVPREEGNYIRYPNVHDAPFENVSILGDAMHGSLFDVNVNTYNGTEKGILSSITVSQKSFDDMTASFPCSVYSTANIDKLDLINLLTDYQAFVGTKPDSEMPPRLHDEISLVTEFLSSTQYKGTALSSSDAFYHPLRSLVNFWTASFSSEMGFNTSRFVRSLKREGVVLTPEMMVEGWALGYLFDHLRKTFAPTGHEGSQEGITPFHQRLADTMSVRIKEYGLEEENWGG